MQPPADQAEHTQHTREAYDQLAAVWSATTDEGPYNGLLKRPALRAMVPAQPGRQQRARRRMRSGARPVWLLDQGAEVIGFDLSPRMVQEAAAPVRRPGPVPGRGPGRAPAAGAASLDGITCSLALHYVADWSVPLRLVRGRAAARRLGGHLARSPVRTAGTRQRGGYFEHRAGQRQLAEGGRRGRAAVLATAAGAGVRSVRRCRARGGRDRGAAALSRSTKAVP